MTAIAELEPPARAGDVRAQVNLAEARVALMLIEAARKSSINKGIEIETPFSQ